MPTPSIRAKSAWLLLALALPAAPTTADAGSRPARQFHAAGSGEMLWLIVGEWNESRQEYVTHLWYREAASDRILPAAGIAASKRVVLAAVADRSLHVFFDNKTHYRYGKNRESRGRQLPDKSLPLAIAGEDRAGLGRLWAVVSAEAAVAIEREWQERKQAREAASDDESRPPRTAPVLSAPPRPIEAGQDLAIVSYDGVEWEPGFEAPPECRGAAAMWLAVADGRHHLLWQSAAEDLQVRYARYESGAWAIATPLSSQGAVQSATAAVVNKQVVFAALTRAANRSGLRCEPWSRAAAAPITDPWNSPPALADDKGAPPMLPVDSAVGLFGDRLALLRPGKDNVEAAFWIAAKGGAAEQAFAPIPSAASGEGGQATRGFRDLLATLIVAAMLLLVFWRRQESVSSPVALPVGFQVASLARRAAGFAIDAAPAAAVVMLIWHLPITTFYQEVRAAAGGDRVLDPPREVLWAWFWFRVMYTVYCTAFEYMTATTPGKRLVGCQVLSEKLERAGFIQIGVRNIARMVELEPALEIWPFLLVVFFTRNRQRMGDLLARTIVVERQPMILPRNGSQSDTDRES